jgi:predicted dehydrogenase
VKHKVLLIGLGQVAMGYDFDTTDAGVVSTHARAFANHTDFELAGGVDPDAGACARFQQRYGGWAGADMAEGLRAVSPDVVVVASPTQYHAEAVQAVLRHAKPKLILCEKPLSYSLEDARAMVATCREAGCLLYVNYLRRVEPGVLEVKRRLQSGAIATPLKGVLWYTKGLLHNGSHFSNLLEFWLGPVEKFSIINAGRAFGEADFEPDVQVKFAAGEVTFLAAREEHYSHHEIHLVAPNGCLRYEQGGGNILWQGVARDPDFPEYTVLSLPGEGIATEGAKLQWQVTDHVSACLRGQSSSLCSGDDALRTLESLLEMKAAL